MRIVIDTDTKQLTEYLNGRPRALELYSKEAFQLISHLWLRVGWNEKYPYTFSWLGRPVIQLPEDLIRIQEVIYEIKPDVIIETGVAHGGSLVYYASICRAIGKGRVIGVDIEIRPHNRTAIEAHELSGSITLVEGDSIDEAVVARVRSLIKPDETVLVILDSCHTKQHVRAELEAYGGLVSVGSYIVATDGIMRDLHDVPRGEPAWIRDNPAAAAEEFVHRHRQFQIEQPAWPFNESRLTDSVTHWPAAWLRRVSGPGS